MSREHCQECGAANLAEAETCWMCRSPLLVVAEVIGPGPHPPTSRGAGEFTLAAGLITVAIIAVLIGVYQQWPGVAFLLTIVVIPPLVATCIASFIRWVEGRPVSVGGSVAVFSTTLGITVTIVVAAVLLAVVLVVVCIAVLFAICMGAAG